MRSVVVARDLLLHEEQGEAFLLHVTSGRYFGLNRAGVVVWKALVDGVDPVDRLCEEWPSRARSVLASDAETLLTQLAEAGLVEAP